MLHLPNGLAVHHVQLYVPAGASACSTAAGKLNAYLAAEPCSKGQYFDSSFNCQACPPFTFQPSDSHYDTECATADVSTCSDAGNFDFTTGTCTCNDAFAGPACEYSNAVTCNTAGVAQPDGSCACNTNDPSVGGIGPACAYTNTKTCNDKGVAQPDGSCNCETAYSGGNCEIYDDCQGQLCSSHGTCIDGLNKYTCNCLDGYTGTDCETNIDECQGITCSSKGTCVDGVNKYICECEAGSTGTD